MVTFEELSARYPIRSVPPFGDCIVVPGAEFDPDWEAELCDLGCAVNFTDLDGRPVTLVRKKAVSKTGGKVVYRPAPAVPAHVPPPLTGLRKTGGKTGLLKQVSSSGPVAGYNWSEDETGLLVELWNKRLSVAEIAERLPGRTVAAVRLRVAALVRKGLIKGRWKCRKRGSEPTCPKCGFTLDLCNCKIREQREKEKLKLPTALPIEKRTEVRTEASTEAHTDACTDKVGFSVTVTITVKLSNPDQLLILHKALREAGLVG